MHRLRQVFAVAIVVASLAVTGCTQAPEEGPALTPIIAPPAIAEEGVLRAGVDLEYPPFGGRDLGREAGIDVDVASAIAAELGLELELVDVKPSELATALAGGGIDIAMSVPFNEASMGAMSLAGSYYADGPAFFTAVESTGSAETTRSVEETITLAGLAGKVVGAQEGSPAYWTLEYELGEGAATSFTTLREALDALEDGEVDVVAGDAFVAAYIARDTPSIVFAGQLSPATSYGVGVGLEATELEEAVRTTLDTLASRGVLDTIRTKWVGQLPRLETAAAE